VNGHIYIYDLKKNQSLPIVSFLAVSKGAAIVSLSFNNHGKLVVSDSFGKVSLWQLSTFLTKIQEGEDQLLQFLFESGK
jgi:WD40 repeat protein